MTVPRGIRLNNPGNVRISSAPWLGKIVPSKDKDFEQFDTPEHGIRALAKTLLAYYRNHSLHNVRQIISRWAPSEENNTEAYIQSVAASLNVGPSDAIVLTHPETLAYMCEAIIQHENGQNPYSVEQVDEGVRMALA